jgi:hypothetical protein
VAWVSSATTPFFTWMFQEQPPVQFTPCVLRTTLSVWKRFR